MLEVVSMRALAMRLSKEGTTRIEPGLTIWWTPTSGFPVAAARVLAAFIPTLKHPGIPVDQSWLRRYGRPSAHSRQTWPSSEGYPIYVADEVEICLVKSAPNCKWLSVPILESKLVPITSYAPCFVGGYQ